MVEFERKIGKGKMLYYNLKDKRKKHFIKIKKAGHIWHTPLISALVRQKQVNLYEYNLSLLYTVNPRPTKAI